MLFVLLIFAICIFSSQRFSYKSAMDIVSLLCNTPHEYIMNKDEKSARVKKRKIYRLNPGPITPEQGHPWSNGRLCIKMLMNPAGFDI